MKVFILTLLSSMFFFNAQAQTSGTLNGRDGITLKYELSKIDDKDKKDQYVVVFTAINTNDYDLYYAVPMMKQKDSTYKLNSFENKSFCDLVVKNSTGLKSLIDNRAKVSGMETQFTTRTNEVLFKISKGQTMSGDLKFYVKSDQIPVLTNEFRTTLRKLDEFDIGINALFINGAWEMSCGNTRMSLSLIKTERGQVQLVQLVNGKQQVWHMVSENVFEKINDKSATLTYNKIGNIFTYSNIDGAVCMWNKR